MADIRTIGTAIESYSIDTGWYPMSVTPGTIDSWIAPTYIKTIPETDGWGNAFYIHSVVVGYTVASCGKASSGGCTPNCTGPCGETHSFSDDIIFSDGHFVQWPEGKQE